MKNKLSGCTGIPISWVKTPNTLPKEIPRRRLGATTPTGTGRVIVADVKKNCLHNQ